MVNHLQHNMSSDTFRAQVAVGSWAGTPLLPDVFELAKMLDKEKGEEKDLEVTNVDTDDSEPE